MLYDAAGAAFRRALLEEGIYAIGFFFPVVPKGQARIRTQISAAQIARSMRSSASATSSAC
jgi:glycine C-acetyltransferase